MFASLLNLVDRLARGRWFWLAVLVVCLGQSGCSNLNLRGEGFAEDDLSNLARQARRADDVGHSDAFSNKARQIDANLGGSRPGYTSTLR